MKSYRTSSYRFWTTADELRWLHALESKGNFEAIRNYASILRAGLRSFDTHVNQAAVLAEADRLLGERSQCQVV